MIKHKPITFKDLIEKIAENKDHLNSKFGTTVKFSDSYYQYKCDVKLSKESDNSFIISNYTVTPND